MNPKQLEKEIEELRKWRAAKLKEEDFKKACEVLEKANIKPPYKVIIGPE